MSKRIYTGFSFFEFVWNLILRVVCVVGLIYALSHYEENPSVIIIVVILCVLFILFIGDDQIIVYNDKVTQTTNSFSSLIIKSKGTTYDISKIKSAFLETPNKSTATEIGATAVLSLVFPKRNPNRDNTHPIYFSLKNGETVKFDTNLESSKMKKIVEIVNSFTK